MAEREGVLRLAAVSREAVTRHRVKVIEGSLEEWLRDKIVADKPRGWDEPFTIQEWDAEVGRANMISESK